jgi:hypothetical protein
MAANRAKSVFATLRNSSKPARARARSSGRLVAYFIISAWQVSGVFGRMPLP